MTTPSAMTSAAPQALREAIVPCNDTPIVFDYVSAKGPEGIRFDVWWANSHLAELADTHRVQALRRYASPSRAGYLAVGELAELPVGDADRGAGPANDMVKHHERFFGEPLGTRRRRDVGSEAIEAAVAYPAFLRVPPDCMDEIGRWYDEEHSPFLLSCPQWIMTRRFRITGARGNDFTHLALHYLTDLRALQSPARDAARDTPWRDRMIAQGWFAPEYRVCYRLQDH